MSRLLTVAVVCFAFAASCHGAFAASATGGETRAVMRDVQLLNLVNGLELDLAQKAALRGKAREALAVQDGFSTRMIAAQAAFTAVLLELRAQLLKGEQASPELKKRLHAAKTALEDLKEAESSEIDGIADSAAGILKGHQVYALEHYTPCLIPPDGTSIGQAAENDGIARKLDNLRKLPDEKYKKVRYAAAGEIYKHIQKNVPAGTALDSEAEMSFIFALLDRVRSMNAAEFSVRKEAIVSEIKDRYKARLPPLRLSARIRNLLLDPAIIPLLDSK